MNCICVNTLLQQGFLWFQLHVAEPAFLITFSHNCLHFEVRILSEHKLHWHFSHSTHIPCVRIYCHWGQCCTPLSLLLSEEWSDVSASHRLPGARMHAWAGCNSVGKSHCLPPLISHGVVRTASLPVEHYRIHWTMWMPQMHSQQFSNCIWSHVHDLPMSIGAHVHTLDVTQKGSTYVISQYSKINSWMLQLIYIMGELTDFCSCP